ncbi:MAG: aconitase X catalytic domain-containing protein [Planctomycetota bacterium]
MTMHLSDTDLRILAGEKGDAARLALRIIVRMAEVLGTKELIEVSQAHIDGCGLLSDASLCFAELLAGKGARVSIPTTLSMGPLDLQRWREFGVPEEYAARAIRQGRAYEAMGCLPTWTCAPYQGYLTPRFGQHLAWGESNAVCYANSVLGARTNRCADYFDICAAICGKVPKTGLHLDEVRRGEVLVRLVGVAEDRWREDSEWSVLGHLLGPLVGNRIAVIEGLPRWATSDQLKALCAAAASSGSVALFHAVGLTPEAPTRDAAFGGGVPEREVTLGPEEFERARGDLSTSADAARLDEVVVGCPHFSYDEFVQLANLLRREPAGRFHEGTRFTVISSRSSEALMRGAGLSELFDEWGVRVTLDTCVFHTPLLAPGATSLMTNSGKCAYYAPGELKVEVAFGTLFECVRSAVVGHVWREGGG